ncbi:MAG TPA: hypothetical protein VMS56_06895 [Thermoanaerobaculia bacterium]|nr:hypothetical protein [Thermoanaerobaculia bacterium]
MEKHVQILAILHIVAGAILLLVGAGVFITLAGAGLLSGDPDAMAVTAVIGLFVGALLFVLSVPSIIAGMGLLRHRPWARVLTLVLAALQILNFPFGTALGIYSFWVLLNEQTTPLFGPAPGAGGV